ncbi:MAG: TrmB family transcriptional regulator [Spirochaetales bacterium]|nr:TrmB family transcriptional regulator [Spirochaetales bacterium]
MEQIYTNLSKFNFTNIETEIYIHLLQYPQLNGSQLAKIVNLPRSTVYNALNNLQKRGAAILISGNISVYQAEDPIILFDRLKRELSEAADTIKEELVKISIKKTTQGFANLQGYLNSLSKVKEFLNSAQKEVYIHTNMQLNLFKEELIELNKKGVRVIVFTFAEINKDNLPVELYYSNKFSFCKIPYSKILLVVDQNKALIARGNKETEYIGVHSTNLILVNLVAEHIHHDVYLHRLEKKLGIKNIVENDIVLNSMQEQQFKDTFE